MSRPLLEALMDIVLVCVLCGLLVVTWGWIGNMFSATQFVIAVVASGVAAFAALEL